ncbi:amidase domain-containing protein [Paenibacillus sp. FA6]|uniref:amidase domain-containing protein n=1 Tax=Paenibacillus sp. FA6 TaxID=3413029 RepID=UPI003F656FA5
MELAWKQVLYTYVNQYNQSQIDCRAETRQQVVTDISYLMERSERMKRLMDWYVSRESQPLRSETRAKLLRMIRETGQEVIVDIQLHTQLFYTKGGMNHREDTIQRERLTMIRDGEQWVIVSIERLIAERHPVSPKTILSNGEETKDSGGSGPYLNSNVWGSGAGRRPTKYMREEAVAYADRWWDSENPEFITFNVNCTNYISQCLFAGGAPIHYTGNRASGWWYKGYASGKEWWSYSWAVANSLEYLLSTSASGLRAEVVDRAEQLMLGDVIIYDWDGDGTYQHSTIVTAFDAGGMPLVNAHTVSSQHRYWDYKNSYAWQENTKYRFLHIPDVF